MRFFKELSGAQPLCTSKRNCALCPTSPFSSQLQGYFFHLEETESLILFLKSSDVFSMFWEEKGLPHVWSYLLL